VVRSRGMMAKKKSHSGFLSVNRKDRKSKIPVRRGGDIKTRSGSKIISVIRGGKTRGRATQLGG